jgi:hypothetical protein
MSIQTSDIFINLIENKEMSINSKIDIYVSTLENVGFQYLVKIVNDKKTDLVVEDEKLRYEICVKLPHITDIYKKDLIFEYIKYDLFINFFYSVKRLINSKQDNYSDILINQYKEIINSDKFRDYYFCILDITNELFLQERYLNYIQNFFISHSMRHVRLIKPDDSCIEDIAKQYCLVIKNLNYKYIVKYVDNNPENIFISSDKIRELINKELANDNELKNVQNIYDFEYNDLKIITEMIYDNYINPKLTKMGFVNIRKIENIIYNNDVCISTIKASLGDKVNYFEKYVKIIIQNIYSKINF